MDDHVFVCYARVDEDFALKLAANLKNQGVSIWLDQWNISAADDWDRSIDKALYGCKYFLIILSSTSVDSREVRGELRTALDENKIIVPILYQPCQIPRQLKIIQYTDFVSRSPDDKEALGHVLRALGMAKNVPEKSPVQSEHEPAMATDWYNKGIALYDQGKYDEAIKAYNKAIELNPQYADAWNNKGIALYDQGKYDEAIKACNKAIELDPQYADAWNNKGNAFYFQGNADEALKAYSKADELDPQNAGILSNKGNALYQQSKYNEALKAYSKAVELDPQNAIALYGKASTLKQLGSIKEANAAFAKAKKLGYKN